MRIFRLTSLPLIALFIAIAAHGQTPAVQAPVEQTPAVVAAPVAVVSHVRAILPDGRRIEPEGSWIALAPYPFAMALKADGSEAALPSIGFPFALNVVSHPDAATATVRKLPPGAESDPAIETHAGMAYSPDGGALYVATGNSGKVAVYRTADWKQTGQIALDVPVGGVEFTQSFAATVVLSADGATLYALDQGNWRVAVVDVATKTVIASMPTGRYPYGLAVSADGGRLYVTNIGLFEYALVPGVRKENPLGTGLKFPAFGYPSKEAREGAVVEGKKVPGLGDENSVEGSSLWTYDVREREKPAVTAKLRLGERITDAHGMTVGGSAPTGVVADGMAVYVSLSHQDEVEQVAADGTHVLAEAALTPLTGARFQDAQGRPLRGVMPSGLEVRDGRLYVAESGIDAVAVVDTATMKVVEHIAAGWNPSAVMVSPDGKTLYVVNTKGKGAGPNGGKEHDANAPSYVGSLEYGGLGVVALDGLGDAAALTAAVVANNTYAIGESPALPRLKHCFLVIRENRTYDETLGDVAGANGDPTLARYGMDGWAEESKEATHLHVTPNMHALVGRFATSDNFHVDSDVSADGHRWAVGINPTPYFNTAWSSGYGGRRTDFAGATQPGRRAMFGGADSPSPEDEPQFGSLWEHIADSGQGILNYGEGLEIEGNDEMDGAAPEGQRMLLNTPLPRPVFEASDRHYPTFNLGIPDQFRVAEFERDFTRRLKAGKIPGLVVIRLPNDHGTEARPGDGYPYRASYMADNDLALGKIVDFLSRTPIWKDSAFFVTEDDSQGGVDHVDAHRSPFLLASPWVKAGSVSHGHSSMGSITRTIDALLGVGYLNLEDALAGDFTGVFGETADLQPFAAVASDKRVFDPALAKLARPKTKAEAAALKDVDDAPEIEKELEKSKGKLKKPDND